MKSAHRSTDLYLSEIFKSIQGESTHAGRICTFIRLSGCNILCTYCDTLYAVHGGVKAGQRTRQEEILNRVIELGAPLVEITGGEPLVQPAVIPLMERLLSAGYQVLLETNGTMDLIKVPSAVIKIMDFKTPSSGFENRNLFRNLSHLGPRDEIKFVVSDFRDYEYARKVIKTHHLDEQFTVLISPVDRKENRREIAEKILSDNLNVRLNLQLHKFVWSPEMTGV